MIFPAITTTTDRLGRRLYWIHTSKNGPKLKVRKVWAEMQLRMRLVIDMREKK